MSKEASQQPNQALFEYIDKNMQDFVAVGILETPTKHLKEEDRNKNFGAQQYRIIPAYIAILTQYMLCNASKLAPNPEHLQKINNIIYFLQFYEINFLNIVKAKTPEAQEDLVNRLYLKLQNQEISIPVTVNTHNAIGRLKKIGDRYLYIEHNSGLGSATSEEILTDDLNKDKKRSFGTSAFLLKKDITEDEIKDFLRTFITDQKIDAETLKKFSSQYFVFLQNELKNKLRDPDSEKFIYSRDHKSQDRGNCSTVSLRRLMQHELGDITIDIAAGKKVLLSDHINNFVRSFADQDQALAIVEQAKTKNDRDLNHDPYFSLKQALSDKLKEISDQDKDKLQEDKETLTIEKNSLTLEKFKLEKEKKNNSYKIYASIAGFIVLAAIALTLFFALPITPIIIAIGTGISALALSSAGSSFYFANNADKSKDDLLDNTKKIAEVENKLKLVEPTLHIDNVISKIVPEHIVRPDLEEEIGRGKIDPEKLETRIGKRREEQEKINSAIIGLKSASSPTEAKISDTEHTSSWVPGKKPNSQEIS